MSRRNYVGIVSHPNATCTAEQGFHAVLRRIGCFDSDQEKCGPKVQESKFNLLARIGTAVSVASIWMSRADYLVQRRLSSRTA